MLGILGFLGPFIPELLKWFRDKDDKKHELDMFRLQMEFASQEHKMRLEEIESTADIQEATVLHQPTQSYGVQLLDAASAWAGTLWGKFLVTPAFYLFTVLDFLSGVVRPGITVAAFTFYAICKWILIKNVGVTAAWTETDYEILVLTLSYWFGHRAAKQAFGGSASTIARGS